LQVVDVLVNIARQLWLEPTPPQSTVIVEVAVSHVPTQPVRFDVPSVIAAPTNDPSIPRLAIPFNAMPPPGAFDVNVA
jgi:hypothetical protein